MTPADRAALREAAQRATPGPWNIVPDPVEECAAVSVPHFDLYAGPADGTGDNVACLPSSEEDARYIAAAHPAAVLDLLDALDTAERGERVLGAFDEADRLEAERDAALARVAELETALRMARVGHDGYPHPCASTRELPCNCGADEHNAAIDRALTPPATPP